MLRISRSGSIEVVRRGPRRPDSAAVERARDVLLLILTERSGLSIRVAAELLGIPRSTAHDRLRAIPVEARETYLRGPSPLTLVGLDRP